MSGWWVLLGVAAVVVLAVLFLTGGSGAVLTRGPGRLGRRLASRLVHGGPGVVQGEVVAARRGLARIRVKVVRMEDEPTVRLDVHTNAWLGYSVRPIRLRRDEALRVAAALEELGKA